MLGVFQEDAAEAGHFGLYESRLAELVEAALGEFCSEGAQFVHLLQHFLEEQEKHD